MASTKTLVKLYNPSKLNEINTQVDGANIKIKSRTSEEFDLMIARQLKLLYPWLVDVDGTSDFAYVSELEISEDVRRSISKNYPWAFSEKPYSKEELQKVDAQMDLMERRVVSCEKCNFKTSQVSALRRHQYYVHNIKGMANPGINKEKKVKGLEFKDEKMEKPAKDTIY